MSFRYEGQEGDLRNGELRFLGIAAFKCTYLAGLTVDMIESAYDKLIDAGEGHWLQEVESVIKNRGGSPSLRHLRICFDDGPCYEFVCEGFEFLIAKPP